jgi:AcrR family transcriptional regulator
VKRKIFMIHWRVAPPTGETIMPTAPDQPSDASRAEARRTQVRTAAAECFRQHGFHGTSIAQISKTAGMSTGHIYHYFENKEAIIADIVAQDLEHLLKLTAELRAASDVKAAMIERAIEGVEANLDPGTAGLQLEIVAEAARNPHIAGIVQAADRQCRASLAKPSAPYAWPPAIGTAKPRSPA